MVIPKIISLDTSTWVEMAKRESAEARELLKFLQTGEVIPFFTLTLLAEILRHGNMSVVEGRLRMLRSLPFVCYIKCPLKHHGGIGWITDLRDIEIGHAVKLPESDWKSTFKLAQDQVTNEFCSGKELCETHGDELLILRSMLPLSGINEDVTAAYLQVEIPGAAWKLKLPCVNEKNAAKDKS